MGRPDLRGQSACDFWALNATTLKYLSPLRSTLIESLFAVGNAGKHTILLHLHASQALRDATAAVCVCVRC